MLAKAARPLTDDQLAAMARIDAAAEAERVRVDSVIRGGAPEIEIPEVLKPTPPRPGASKKERRAYQARMRRAKERKRALEVAAIAAAKEEQRAEGIAPAVRRRAIVAADGKVIRGPALRPDGATFCRANQIEGICAAHPRLVTKAHVAASWQLLRAYEEVGGGIGLGASDYLAENVRGGSGGVSEAKHSALMYQCRMRAQFEGALVWLGGEVGIISAILFRGLSLDAWSRESGCDYRIGLGRLAAALGRLVEFYEPADERRVRIKAIYAADLIDPAHPIA